MNKLFYKMKNVGLFPFLLLFIFNSYAKKEEINLRPNIFFIMTDTAADNAISAYNKTLIETPNIDREAKNGVLFENAFVTNSIYTALRTSIPAAKHSHFNGKIINLYM